MPKPIVWKNPNKQDLTTGNVTFDRANKAIMRFQCVGDTQVGFSVRAYNDTTMPNGDPTKPGHLQDFDLKYFPEMPGDVRAFVRSEARDKSLMVHQFFHYRGQRKVIHGYLIVRDNVVIRGFCTSGRAKSYMVLDAVAPYVANVAEGEAIPYDRYR